MDVLEMKKVIASKDYNFLRENKHLGDNVILIGVGGSYAYGTEKPDGTSDLDIRGVATRKLFDILTGHDFDQVVVKEDEPDIDATIYSFDKIVKLLCECNPNTIEMLGLRREHYLYLTDVGQQLLDNAHLFLSKRAIHSFGGYAHAQLRRLENKSARVVGQAQREAHILRSISHAEVDYRRKYFPTGGNIKLYLGDSTKTGYDQEIKVDFNLKGYPLRDMCSMINEMNAVVSAYNKIGHRNQKAITHDKLGKHMCHLVRLYLMCFDILEFGEINTYRTKEREFLMDIRNGAYLLDDSQPTKEFYDMVDEFDNKLVVLGEKTELPEMIDKDKIAKFVTSVNYGVIERGQRASIGF